VRQYEINKFPPSIFKQGRFLREDWTACTDIGRSPTGNPLDKPEYLRVEGLYITAVATLAGLVQPDLLQVHGLEFWETTSDRLAAIDLAEVLDGSGAPADGEPVTGARLENLVRRCLRDVAWLELIVAPRLLIHFGYDMRLIVASSIPIDGALDQIRSSGLFVYASDAPLPTLDAWVGQI
jgi:hypothetical protein